METIRERAIREIQTCSEWQDWTEKTGHTVAYMIWQAREEVWTSVLAMTEG